MPAGSLLALLDDIASVLDDVATMTKVATKKCAGILGDDLALNAQQVAGVTPDRELPVVWAVAKGSLRNKAILVPLALALSAFAPWAVLPLLMVGGAYLCFEGFEKLVHKLLHPDPARSAEHAERMRAIADPAVDLAAHERERIRGAVRTDFVLSAEIVAITLGAVSDSAFAVRAGVVVAIALLMTVGVYGFVAAILKVDDLGLRLASVEGRGKRARARRRVGRGILAAAPVFLRLLSIVGTAAMFLVGGGIIAHGIPPLGHAIDDLGRSVGGAVGAILPTLLQGLLGVVTGGLLVLIYVRAKRAFARPDGPTSPAPDAHMSPPRPRVLALLGDSILDNGSYTHPAPDTTALVRRLLGSDWVVERGARDGATMTDIASQVAALPPGRPDVLVLSVGGNDLMERVGGPPFTRSLSEIFSALPEIAEEFGARYAEVLESLRPATDRLLVCTIYDVPFSDAEVARLGKHALGLLNDRILLSARRFGVEVLELRDVCTEPGDFVLQIEPSAEGARKIAVAIAEAVRGSPATRSGTG